MTIPLTTPTSLVPGCAAAAFEAILTRLGHRGCQRCRSAVAQLDARVWFTRRRESVEGHRRYAQVVVDTGAYQGSPLRRMQLLRQINDCTGADGIRVSERRPGDAGRALAAAGRQVAG